MRIAILFCFLQLFSATKINSQCTGDKSSHLLNLIEQGIIDSSNNKIRYILKVENQIDGPSLLNLILDLDPSFASTKLNKLKTIISLLDLDGYYTEKLLGDSIFLKLNDNKLQAEALKISVLQNYTSNSEVKKMFYNNAVKKGMISENKDFIEDYLEPNIKFSSIFNSLSGFKPLGTISQKNSLELIKLIDQFFVEISKIENITLNTKLSGNDYIVKSQSEVYSIPLQQLADHINDISFYKILLNYGKQIATDNNSSQFFSIIDPLEDIVDIEMYKQTLEIFPYLSVGESIYLYNAPKSTYDPFGEIGFSFPNTSECICTQLSLYKLFIGDIDAGKEYLNTENKKRFLSLLIDYKDDLDFSHSDFVKLNRKISSVISDNVIDFLNLIDGIGYSVSRIPFHSQTKAKIEGQSFKNVFPLIYSWTNDDYGINNITLNVESNKISFIRRNKEYRINFSERDMIDFIYKKDLINKDKKYIHIPSDFGQFHTYYYLLSDRFAEEIQLIFGNVFE